MSSFPIVGNTYPVKDQIKALGCKWDRDQRAWIAPNERIRDAALALLPAEKPQAEATNVGGMAGVVELLTKARNPRLLNPAVLVLANGQILRLSIAGERSAAPGAINVTSPGSYENRTWYGRVGRDGTFAPGRDTTQETATALVVALQALQADPQRAAAEYGRLTGNCCFCGTALTDEQSTMAGYGKTCAGHYHLPYPKKAEALAYHAQLRAQAAAADDSAMDRMVQEAERLEDERVARFKMQRDAALAA
jgi:hypothetical protein